MKKSQIYDAMNALLNRQNSLLKQRKNTTVFSASLFQKYNNPDITKFSKVDLPLMVKGTLITPGTYKDTRFGKIIITPDALKESASKWSGIHIFNQHGIYEAAFLEGRDVPIDSVIGIITEAVWNPDKNTLDYEAEIDDESIAFKIVRGLIKHVSVSFTQDKTPFSGGVKFKNIKPLDLCLVFNPRDKNASIEPK